MMYWSQVFRPRRFCKKQNMLRWIFFRQPLSWLVQNIKKALSNSQRIMTIPAVNVPIDKILTHYSRLHDAKISRKGCLNKVGNGLTEEMKKHNNVMYVTLYHQIFVMSRGDEQKLLANAFYV